MLMRRTAEDTPAPPAKDPPSAEVWSPDGRWYWDGHQWIEQRAFRIEVSSPFVTGLLFGIGFFLAAAVLSVVTTTIVASILHSR